MLKKVSWGFVVVAATMLLGCNRDSSGSGDARIVANEDGTVEVVVGDQVRFALAATGPVARSFRQRPVGVGTVTFERSFETSDPLSVQAVSGGGTSARIEYANADGTRSAVLSATVVSEQLSEFRLEPEGRAADSIAVGVRCDENGTFHGFGEQYNATNQRGEVFELLVNEQLRRIQVASESG